MSTAEERDVLVRDPRNFKPLACGFCGCTEQTPCEGGCSWISVDPPVCSACAQPGTPMFNESIGGSLIDAARISLLGAIALLPDDEPPPLIVTSESDEQPAPTVHDCLEQAMQWLNAARSLTMEKGAPVTSLHVVKR